MTRSKGTLQAVLISAVLLSGCQPRQGINHAPEPFYPSCETVRHLNRPDVPDAVWRDVLGMTIVMEQIRETMPAEERPKLGECKL